MIVIPMAGLSSRFRQAGYQLPKYMLEAHGKTLFEHAVESFKQYFESECFLFIALDVDHTKRFIEIKCEELGIVNFSIAILDAPTRGQAETVYKGLKTSHFEIDEGITIFNIDTFRPGFTHPDSFCLDTVDGYLETFIGEGDNWSNILPSSEGDYKVELTAEKKGISEYCCTGLYYWSSAYTFMRLFESYKTKNLTDLEGGEFYIAPMYNDLIKEGGDVRFSVIPSSQVIFCGVPSEYIDFLRRG